MAKKMQNPNPNANLFTALPIRESEFYSKNVSQWGPPPCCRAYRAQGFLVTHSTSKPQRERLPQLPVLGSTARGNHKYE